MSLWWSAPIGKKPKSQSPAAQIHTCQTTEPGGFDQGLFVPLKLVFPNADIPCIQLSFKAHLDAKTHIEHGETLARLKLPAQNILILGSGFSFHNMRAFGSQDAKIDARYNQQNHTFQDGLQSVCTSKDRDHTKQQLINWQQAPAAQFCHPGAEHLLPLHVCFGAADMEVAKVLFEDVAIGKKTLGFSWG